MNDKEEKQQPFLELCALVVFLCFPSFPIFSFFVAICSLSFSALSLSQWSVYPAGNNNGAAIKTNKPTE